MPFVVRRFLHCIVLLLCSSLLSFALVQLAPGDFFDSMQLNPKISPATIDQLRQRHGSNHSFPQRYLLWLYSIARGDFGMSLTYNQPVAAILWPRLANTLLLTTAGTLVAWLCAVPLGILAAVKPKSLFDGFLSFSISALLATPELVLALGLLFVAVRSGYFPGGGMLSLPTSLDNQPSWRVLWDLGRHLFVPTLCLATGVFPPIAAHARSSMRSVLQAPFVAAARGLGIPLHRIVVRHAFPVAANQLISLFGLSLGTLVSASLLVEAVFSWPGAGQLLLEAIFNRDLFLVIDIVFTSSVFLIIGNFMADLLLYVTDPRIRVS